MIQWLSECAFDEFLDMQWWLDNEWMKIQWKWAHIRLNQRYDILMTKYS